MTGWVRFRVLGAIGGDWGPTTFEVTAARQRALLALLLVHANRTMSPSALIDGIWGETTPQHPDAALQIVVSRLRTALGPAACRLVSGPSGYCLEVEDNELDLSVARARFADGQRAMADDEPARAAIALDDALACWSGDALTDLGGMPFADEMARDLHELRFAMYELRNDAYLRCGRHVELLADIEPWVRQEPWRERLRAQQMLALYRAGRQVAALAVYENVRHVLLEELGVNPSEDLRELSTRILEHDPTLLYRHGGVATSLPRWTSRFLPFVGRGTEEELVIDRFRQIAIAGSHFVFVEGDAGIGKSRFVLEMARRLRDDVIMVAVDADDTLRPGVQTVAQALADASSGLSDAELRMCLGRWPGDAAAVVPALRRRFPDLPAPLEADDAVRTDRLRSAVASWIAGLSQRAPVLLLLDDLHRAGPGLLMLLGALATSDEAQRILVLGTVRSDLDEPAPRLAQLVERLRRHESLDRIRLSSLGEIDIARLLEQFRAHEAEQWLPALVQATQGHPLLLNELLHETGIGISEEAAAADVPGRIRDFALRRVQGLGNGAEAIRRAAVIGTEFDIPLLSTLISAPEAVTAAVVDQAIEADVLNFTRVGSFAFTHELTRTALAESFDDVERASLHRHIATALEQRGADPATLALHWSRASGRGAAHKTAAWADAAGQQSLQQFDPHGAMRWFDLAVSAAGDQRQRAQLLVRLADATSQAGEPGTADALREAVRIARALKDDHLLAQVGTVYAPVWASIPSLEIRERIAVLRQASTRATDPALRAQLLGRLGTEYLYTRSHARVTPLLDDALVSARASGDPRLLSNVLLRHAYGTAFPTTLDERRRNLAEALAITGETNDVVTRFGALTMAAGAAIEAAQRDEADGFLAEAFALSDQMRLPMLAFNEAAVRAWHVGLDGDLDHAERLAFQAGKLATKNRVQNPTLGVLLQIGCIRWLQERFVELLPFIHLAPAGVATQGMAIVASRALAASPDTIAESRVRFAEASRDGFEGLARDTFWATDLIFAAETAFLLGDAAAGRTIAAQLAPFVDQVAIAGNWPIAPIAYGAAMASAAARLDDTYALFERSLEIADRLRAPVMRARIQLSAARALLAGDDEVLRETALPLVEEARIAFEHFGMDVAARSAEVVRGVAAQNVASIRGRRRADGTRAS
jgi:DNA-binding SARP family transcriptional activator